MTLLEAIQACAAFTHKLPGHIYGELRGRRVPEGIELDATDGMNAIRVLVANDSLATCHGLLPEQWTVTHAAAGKLADIGHLTIVRSTDSASCASEIAKIGKSGTPGKAKLGPEFRALSEPDECARRSSWGTFDSARGDILARMVPHAYVKLSALRGALEPLDGSAEVIFAAHGPMLHLTAGPWTTNLDTVSTFPGDKCASSLPIRLLVAPLWTALESMERDTVTLSWASLPEDSSVTAATHREGGPMLVECGGVSFLTMPLREIGLIKAA